MGSVAARWCLRELCRRQPHLCCFAAALHCTSAAGGAQDTMTDRAERGPYLSSSQARTSGQSSAAGFLYDKFAEDVPELQELMRQIVRKNQAKRQRDIVPKEVVHKFCQRYNQLDTAGRDLLLLALAREFSPSPADVSAAIQRYSAAVQACGMPGCIPDTKQAPPHERLQEDITPMYEVLFQNVAAESDSGVEFLVGLRADLLQRLRKEGGSDSRLEAMDASLRGMLQGWFSTSFLELRRITYEESPGAILEKIAKYEAVHEVRGLTDLKARLGQGRRCFAFFHPCMPQEPLVFVHVALLPEMAASMDYIAKHTGKGAAEQEASCAVFYSISSTQKGLQGVQLGNFLIKRVVNHLRMEFPEMTTFATLSPAPNFMSWLKTQVVQAQALGSSGRFPARPLMPHDDAAAVARLCGAELEHAGAALLQLLGTRWHEVPQTAKALKPVMLRLFGKYIAQEKHRQRLVDPVANFHVTNGAYVGRLNWLADPSLKGLRQSAGLMVNYKYDIKLIEPNHQAYVASGDVMLSLEVSAVLA